MSDRCPTILALGGGGFTSPPGDPALDELVLELAGVRDPKILFLPTASGDPAEQIAGFHGTFGDRGVDATCLSLFRLHGSEIPIRELVLAQDLVYVGGGSMRNLLAIWQAHGFDEILRDAWQAGVVMAGLSAGAMCWFQGGVTMSGGPPEPIDGLGLLSGSLSVHADGDPERLPVYLDAVKSGRLPGGWALDDGVGLVIEGEEVTRVVSARPGSRALKVDCVAGEIVRRHVEPVLLGHADPALRPLSEDVRELRRLRSSRRT